VCPAPSTPTGRVPAGISSPSTPTAPATGPGPPLACRRSTPVRWRPECFGRWCSCRSPVGWGQKTSRSLVMEKLSVLEQRIIGCLIEKQVSTPEVYPLTLNSLVNACNQKSNREPVMSLDEQEVQSVLNTLIARRLVNNVAGFNARAAKFQHRFCNTEFGELQFSPGELAIVC